MTAITTVRHAQTDRNAIPVRRQRRTGVPVRKAVRPALHAIPVRLIRIVRYPADMPVYQGNARKNVHRHLHLTGVLLNRHVRLQLWRATS